MIELLSIYFPGLPPAAIRCVALDRHFDAHLDRDCPSCRGGFRWRIERDYR